MTYFLSDKQLNNASAILRVRGPDANTYLQGQFTQDVRLAEKAPIYGLWLDQKGKVLADSHILKTAPDEFLIATGVPAGPLLARLESYLIADEVELHDETDRWRRVLLWGDPMVEFDWPPGVLRWPSRRAAPGGLELLVPASREGELARALRRRAAESSPAEAELARLRAGLPAVPGDIGPRDLPAEGALDEVAISYTKGCYLGQEVIARLKNLGQVRRALHLVAGAGPPPAPGTALFQGEHKAGELRSGAPDGGGFLAFAMLSLVQLDAAAPLRLAPGGDGIRIVRRV